MGGRTAFTRGPPHSRLPVLPEVVPHEIPSRTPANRGGRTAFTRGPPHSRLPVLPEVVPHEIPSRTPAQSAAADERGEGPAPLLRRVSPQDRSGAMRRQAQTAA